MEIIMKKEKHSDDKISEGKLHEILLDIKYRLDGKSFKDINKKIW